MKKKKRTGLYTKSIKPKIAFRDFGKNKNKTKMKINIDM